MVRYYFSRDNLNSFLTKSLLPGARVYVVPFTFTSKFRINETLVTPFLCSCFASTLWRRKKKLFWFYGPSRLFHSFRVFDDNSGIIFHISPKKHMSHLMRLWYFLSSVNSFFKHACAVIQWGPDVWFLVGPFVYFHNSCVRIAKALARLRRCLCDKYHNLMSWLIYCGYSLESTHQGDSNEYPQHLYLRRTKENCSLTRICFLREKWCLPYIGEMQFCTESQVLVQQRDINSESK